MDKKFLEEMQKMMVQVFNDGYEQLIMPRIDELEEKFEKKLDKMGKELREEFKKGQQSLSNRFEEVERKMDLIVKSDVEQNKRLDRIERVVKAN